MNKVQDIQTLAKEIDRQLLELENYFWDVFVLPGYGAEPLGMIDKVIRDDKETWLFHGTRQLYYKICLFLELKNLPVYLSMFTSSFSFKINLKEEVMKDRGPLFDSSEPSMIIHDDFRDFLSGFPEFERNMKRGSNKVKLILENTGNILAKVGVTPNNEATIYKAVKWFIEIVYPETRDLNKSRFIKKFKTYKPDILIPETSSAIEYKFIRKGNNIAEYLNQIKTDADCYQGDPEYKFFYAVVYFQDKHDYNPGAFNHAIAEKAFPENWTIIAA